MIVDSGPAAVGNALNEPFVSITLCSPSNPTNCQTIDHILVDTGSVGLRLVATAISPTLGLTQQTDTSGNALAECASFADGYAWGTLKTANLQIGTETANNLTVHIIGDSNYPNIPGSCSATGIHSENTVATFGSNGVIGVGLFAVDCGSGCAQSNQYPVYYSCSSSTSCQQIALNLNKQLQNPVTQFATDNNGVVLSMPSVSGTAAATATGTLTFGIGTQSNNGLGSAQVYTVDTNPTDSNFSYLTTTYNGASYIDSFIDSGSNGYFFTDNSITPCQNYTGFYCPAGILNLSATIIGHNNSSSLINFSVGNVETFGSTYPNDAVYTQLGGENAGDPASFDWGFPFFYGRNVYVAINGYSTPGGSGPYFAF